MHRAQMARRKDPSTPRSARPRRLRNFLLGAAAGGFVLAALYAGFTAMTVGAQFEGRRWDVPAQVYAAPLELYAGPRAPPGRPRRRAQTARLSRGPAPRPRPALTASAWAASRSRRAASTSPATRSLRGSCRSRSRAARITSAARQAGHGCRDRAPESAVDRQLVRGARRGSPDRSSQGHSAAAAGHAQSRRGPAVRHAPRRRSARDAACDVRERHVRRDSPGREHADAAARAQLLPVERPDVGAQATRGADEHRARAALQQRRADGGLRQRDLSRPGRRARGARLRAREPVLFRQAARASSTCTSSRCSSRKCADPRTTIRAAIRTARASAATSCCSDGGAKRARDEQSRAGAAKRELEVSSTYAAQRNAVGVPVASCAASSPANTSATTSSARA